MADREFVVVVEVAMKPWTSKFTLAIVHVLRLTRNDHGSRAFPMERGVLGSCQSIGHHAFETVAPAIWKDKVRV